MKILCIGDIVGKPGREALQDLLPQIREEHRIDFTIVNAENAAGGAGLTPRIAEQLLQIGCDVITLGDHVWDQKDLESYLDETDNVIRPANFPSETPGKGLCIKQTSSGLKVGVINLIGRVFMRYQVNCPFRTIKEILEKIKKETSVIIVDMHAEATSEKIALASYVDGQISALFGTHTHVQTADERILPGKTGFITDLGMTGPIDSIIGQSKEGIIQRFLLSMPIKFCVAAGDVQLSVAVLDVDEKTGLTKNITRIQKIFRFSSQDAWSTQDN